MLRAAAVVVVVCLIGATLAFPAEAAQDPGTKRFIGEIERSVPGLLERYEVPTASVAVIEGSKVAWTKRFDTPGVERRGDVFQVASLSKTATSLAVLRLVERGRIDLDAPVDRYLKRWHVPRSRFDESRVTARRLLTHTAGFPVSGSGVRAVRYPPAEDILNGKHGLAAAKLETQPGTAFKYSNPGYVVLELLVEEVTGNGFSDAMRELVFEPMNMSDSGYDDDGKLVARAVRGHRRTGVVAARQIYVPRGPGGLFSTPSDIARMLSATWLSSEKGGLLGVNTLEEMDNWVPESEGAFGMGEDAGYALGLAVATFTGDSGSRVFVANNGSFEGFNAMMFGMQDDIGAVVLTNSDTGLGIELELVVSLLDEIVGHRPPFMNRLVLVRVAVRSATLAALVFCLAFVVFIALGFRHGRRAWPGRLRVRPLLLKTVPLLVISIALFALFDTGWLTQPLGGIPPARFISGDYRWLVAGLALALFAIGAAATGLPKVRQR